MNVEEKHKDRMMIGIIPSVCALAVIGILVANYFGWGSDGSGRDPLTPAKTPETLSTGADTTRGVPTVDSNTVFKTKHGSCVTINTARWGNISTYDASKPEIPTAYQALVSLGLNPEDAKSVVVWQGQRSSEYQYGTPLANGSMICK